MSGVAWEWPVPGPGWCQGRGWCQGDWAAAHRHAGAAGWLDRAAAGARVGCVLRRRQALLRRLLGWAERLQRRLGTRC